MTQKACLERRENLVTENLELSSTAKVQLAQRAAMLFTVRQLGAFFPGVDSARVFYEKEMPAPYGLPALHSMYMYICSHVSNLSWPNLRYPGTVEDEGCVVGGSRHDSW